MNVLNLKDNHDSQQPNTQNQPDPEQENYLTAKDIQDYNQKSDPGKDQEVSNPEKRKLLKFILLAGGGFILGRLFSPVLKLFSPPDSRPAFDFSSEQQPTSLTKESEFKNFKVVEKNNKMVFVDKQANEEVLELDWN